MKIQITILHLTAAVFIFSGATLARQQKTALETIQALNLPVSKGNITIYYADGYEKRAAEVRPLIEEMMAFLRKEARHQREFFRRCLDPRAVDEKSAADDSLRSAVCQRQHRVSARDERRRGDARSDCAEIYRFAHDA